MIETVFRTEDLPAGDRFDFWRELMSSTHAPMDLSSDFAADYQARQRVIGLGEVQVWPATFQPVVFRRTPKLIKQSDPEVYHLSLLLRGRGGVTWGSQEAAFDRPYDFHTNDSSRPYDIWTGPDPITLVGLEVPKPLLLIPREKADQAIGRPLSGRQGVGALLAQFLTQIITDTNSYRPSDQFRLGTVAIDLLSALFAHTLDADDSLQPESCRRSLSLRVRAFIHQNLGDPELCPACVAAAHHISLRSLHRLFQSEGTSVAAFIRHHRLERIRRDLADPALNERPIHAIAARWGFPRAADFTRAFRNTYGMPPSEYRNTHADPAGPLS